MTIESTIRDMAKAARGAANKLVRVSTDQKNAALLSIAAGLENDAAFIKEKIKRILPGLKKWGFPVPCWIDWRLKTPPSPPW
jgi:gamma-glutamyl phosphate reductase